MQIRVDPEFQAFIPPLSHSEFASLEADIVATGGPTTPIDIWYPLGEADPVIVDGHNRWKVCQKNNLNPAFRVLQFPDRAAVLAHMFQHQIARRNLSTDQIVALAALRKTRTDRGTGRQRAMAAELNQDSLQYVVSGALSIAQAYTKEFPPQRRSAAPTHERREVATPEVPQEVVIAGAARTILVMPDTHLPYHDKLAFQVFLAAAREIRPDVLVIIGDLWDHYEVSFYGKDPFKRRGMLQYELDDAAPYVEMIRDLKIPQVEFCCGNHEYRLDRYIGEKAPELAGMVRTMRDIIPAEWRYHAFGTSLRMGKMLYSHEFGRCGVNATRQGLQDVGANICFGHTHRLGVDYIGQAETGVHVALNVGWLGDLNEITYKHKNLAKRTYQHGFGLVDEDAEGNVWAHAVPIIGRKCMVRGKEISL